MDDGIWDNRTLAVQVGDNAYIPIYLPNVDKVTKFKRRQDGHFVQGDDKAERNWYDDEDIVHFKHGFEVVEFKKENGGVHKTKKIPESAVDDGDDEQSCKEKIMLPWSLQNMMVKVNEKEFVSIFVPVGMVYTFKYNKEGNFVQGDVRADREWYMNTEIVQFKHGLVDPLAEFLMATGPAADKEADQLSKRKIPSYGISGKDAEGRDQSSGDIVREKKKKKANVSNDIAQPQEGVSKVEGKNKMDAGVDEDRILPQGETGQDGNTAGKGKKHAPWIPEPKDFGVFDEEQLKGTPIPVLQSKGNNEKKKKAAETDSEKKSRAKMFVASFIPPESDASQKTRKFFKKFLGKRISVYCESYGGWYAATGYKIDKEGFHVIFDEDGKTAAISKANVGRNKEHQIKLLTAEKDEHAADNHVGKRIYLEIDPSFCQRESKKYAACVVRIEKVHSSEDGIESDEENVNLDDKGGKVENEKDGDVEMTDVDANDGKINENRVAGREKVRNDDKGDVEMAGVGVKDDKGNKNLEKGSKVDRNELGDGEGDKNGNDSLVVVKKAKNVKSHIQKKHKVLFIDDNRWEIVDLEKEFWQEI